MRRCAIAASRSRPRRRARRWDRALCETVQSVSGVRAGSVLVCDGGEFGQWAQAYCSAPVRIINGMSGAIGAGLCYALAAKIARRGDGAGLMGMARRVSPDGAGRRCASRRRSSR